MGGRGTFAAGNPVPYTYEADTENFENGLYEGIKVLKGVEGSNKHSLPESSHSSFAYLKMNPDGSFNMLRVYDRGHNLRLEIAYHRENNLAKDLPKVLHYHIYSTSFSQNKTGPYIRTTNRLHKNTRLYKHFKKYFKGVDL